MALPTFDFFNIIRVGISAIIKTAKSPIVYFAAMSLSMGVIFNQLYQSFIGLSIPSISANLTLPSDQSGVVDYFVYMLNVDQIVTIFNGFIAILNAVISFIPGVLLGLLVAVRLYLAQKHVYETVRDISRT